MTEIIPYKEIIRTRKSTFNQIKKLLDLQRTRDKA